MVHGFSVKLDGAVITIINHRPDGTVLEVDYTAEDAQCLAALLSDAHTQFCDNQFQEWADIQAENESLRRGEGGGVPEREARLEVDYDGLHHDEG